MRRGRRELEDARTAQSDVDHALSTLSTFGDSCRRMDGLRHADLTCCLAWPGLESSEAPAGRAPGLPKTSAPATLARSAYSTLRNRFAAGVSRITCQPTAPRR